jgi:hypothetical protein
MTDLTRSDALMLTAAIAATSSVTVAEAQAPDNNKLPDDPTLLTVPFGPIANSSIPISLTVPASTFAKDNVVPSAIQVELTIADVSSQPTDHRVLTAILGDWALPVFNTGIDPGDHGHDATDGHSQENGQSISTDNGHCECDDDVCRWAKNRQGIAKITIKKRGLCSFRHFGAAPVAPAAGRFVKRQRYGASDRSPCCNRRTTCGIDRNFIGLAGAGSIIHTGTSGFHGASAAGIAVKRCDANSRLRRRRQCRFPLTNCGGLCA